MRRLRLNNCHSGLKPPPRYKYDLIDWTPVHLTQFSSVNIPMSQDFKHISNSTHRCRNQYGSVYANEDANLLPVLNVALVKRGPHLVIFAQKIDYLFEEKFSFHEITALSLETVDYYYMRVETIAFWPRLPVCNKLVPNDTAIELGCFVSVVPQSIN